MYQYKKTITAVTIQAIWSRAAVFTKIHHAPLLFLLYNEWNLYNLLFVFSYRINTSTSIDHDNHFEDFSSCGPGVITGGNVNLGELSHIGIGAVVKNNIKIGQNTVVGGNSFVNKNCVNNHFFYGTPIKKVKKKLVTDNYLK